MKLFCSTCKMEVSKDIAVYENVDGYTIHCNLCNEPIMQIGFDDPTFNDLVAEEKQYGLFDNIPAFSDEDGCCGCSCDSACEESEPSYKDLVFTNDDLALIYKTLYSKAVAKKKSYGQIVALLDKITELMEYRQCP